MHPLTTIGWNLAHIAGTPGRLADLDILGGPVPVDAPIGPPDEVVHSAAGAVATLRSGWRRLDEALQSADDIDLERSWTWPFGLTNGYQHVALMLNEVSHHGAQVCELRDLHRAMVR